MDLNKSNDPKRILKWNGKSIATCSKVELQACIIHLSQQLAQAARQSMELDPPREMSRDEMIAAAQKPLSKEEIKMMFPLYCIVCGVVDYEEGRGYAFITSTEAGGTYCSHHTTEEVQAAAQKFAPGSAGYNADEKKESPYAEDPSL